MSFTPYATNAVNAAAKPIDYAKAYSPTVQLYHGGSIVVNNKAVGRILTWSPAGAYNREGTHIYEVQGRTWGLPVDYAPGRATGFNITWTRNEVWSDELEKALGWTAVWENLTDQNYPFIAKEYLYRGTQPYRMWSYLGCWFTEKNPSEWAAEGEGVISVTCAMAYISRKKSL